MFKQFLKFDFFLSEKDCFNVVDMEVQMYVDELQANFSPVPKYDKVFSCSCQNYSFNDGNQFYVECTSCLRQLHPSCAYPALKRNYTRQDLKSLAAGYVCPECASATI